MIFSFQFLTKTMLEERESKIVIKICFMLQVLFGVLLITFTILMGTKTSNSALLILDKVFYDFELIEFFL